MRACILVALAALTLLVSSCGHVISKGLREEVDKNVLFKDVLKDPEAYKGKVAMWGGVIIEARNQKDGTLFEVLQKPLAWDGRPKEGDESLGRFLALYNGFLDTAIYAKGREITVAGEIQGKQTAMLGEIEYHYPSMIAREVYLWPDRAREQPPPIIIYPRIWDYPYPYPPRR